MNRKLSYNGKELWRMSFDELNIQLKTNKLRLILRTLFLILVTLAAGFAMPILIIVPMVILFITNYWLLENNKEIQRELYRR